MPSATPDVVDIDAQFDPHFDSWLFGCHVCRREAFPWLFGQYQSWSQRQVYVHMLWHRESAHQDLDESGRFALVVGFDHVPFEAELP